MNLMQMRKPHLELAKTLWRAHLQPGDLVIDATVGNGHDALFLAELGCEVIGLDIQEEALQQTKKRLGDRPVTVKLFQLSHAKIDTLPLSRRAKLIIYNLGYLPGGDKQITTQEGSTLQSVSSALWLLEAKGALCITCYPGHDEGLKEEQSLMEWAASLPAALWEVRHHRWLERPRAPSLLWIQKLHENRLVDPGTS